MKKSTKFRKIRLKQWRRRRNSQIPKSWISAGFVELSVDLSTVAPRPIYHENWLILRSKSPVFLSPPVISSFSHWLCLRFRPEEMGKASVSAELERGNSIYVNSGPSEPIFYRIWILSNKTWKILFTNILIIWSSFFTQFFSFSKKLNFNFKIWQFFSSVDIFRGISVIFKKIGHIFKPWWSTAPLLLLNFGTDSSIT
jgi:hypothetical protein